MSRDPRAETRSDQHGGKRRNPRAETRQNKLVCISHWSALQYWRIPFLDTAFAVKDFTGGLLQTCVFRRRHRYRRPDHQVRCYKLHIPEKYLYHDRRNDIYVVQPEFAYLQAVEDLDIHDAILLGILFCAHPNSLYSEPLTTREKLLACARELVGHRGRRRALRALHYVADGCNSRAEAGAFMALALPNALGGLGLRSLRFNVPLELEDPPGEPLTRFADFYLDEDRAVIEYDSDAHHSSPEARAADELRAELIRRNNYSCTPMYTRQAMEASDFESFAAFLLRTVLKRRLRIRTPRFWQMRLRIQQILAEFPPSEETRSDVDRYVTFLEARAKRWRRNFTAIVQMFKGPARWGFAGWEWREEEAEALRPPESDHRRGYPVTAASELGGRGNGKRRRSRAGPGTPVPVPT